MDQALIMETGAATVGGVASSDMAPAPTAWETAMASVLAMASVVDTGTARATVLVMASAVDTVTARAMAMDDFGLIDTPEKN